MRVKRNTGKIKRNGYWYILRKNHPNSGKQGYIAEHRLVIERHLGRFLGQNEVVHHKNGIITDNRLKNLELFSSPGQHTKSAHSDLFEEHSKKFKGCHFSKRTEFKKGTTPWNKGRKGIMPTPWNKVGLTTNCLFCNKIFHTAPCKIKNGRGKFCSKKCFDDIRRGKKR